MEIVIGRAMIVIDDLRKCYGEIKALDGLTLWSHEVMTNFTTVALLPMTFLGGTFFPRQNLPTAVSGYIPPINPCEHEQQCRDARPGGFMGFSSSSNRILSPFLLPRD